jgi:hypothetical protein
MIRLMTLPLPSVKKSIINLPHILELEICSTHVEPLPGYLSTAVARVVATARWLAHHTTLELVEGCKLAHHTTFESVG